MKTLIFIFSMIISSSIISQDNKSFYDFTVKTIDGEEISLREFEGMKVLLVNVASKCGYTKQYEGLQQLYEKYGGDDFVIICFPANNFLKQEPGSNEEIKEFCTLNYGVSFPMMSKISVKGNDQDPLYAWLTQKELNGVMDSKVKWNFQKYMINEKGELVNFVSPGTKPFSEEIVNWITSDQLRNSA